MRAGRETPPLKASTAGRDDLDEAFEDEAAAEADLDPEPDADGAVTRDAAPRIREGLPPSYRMRAEPHYVEALVGPPAPAEPAPSPAPPGVPAAPVPGAAAQRDETSVVSPAAMAAAASTLAEAFDAIQAALRDVPLRGRPLRDRVAIELARAEATRGRWLADAAMAMQTEPLPALDEVDLVTLLADVFEAFGPENRLSGGAAAVPVPTGACLVFGDGPLLTTTLGAMLAAVRALIEDRGDARKVRVALGPRREAATRTLEVVQTAVRLPAAAYGRFFDAGWADHPAGPQGALLLAASRKIARAHGGGLEVAPVETGGCTLILSLPAAD
ncbi:MAG: hypothetical protein R2708_09530 [Vicinamibacterales bacterium]